MKRIIRNLAAACLVLAPLAACTRNGDLSGYADTKTGSISLDVESVDEVDAKAPGDISVIVDCENAWIATTSSNWISSIKPNYGGGGKTIVTITVSPNFRNDQTDMDARTGSVVFSSHGTTVTLPISQNAFVAEKIEIETLGGIPTFDEWKDFVKAVNTDMPLDRWKNEDGEVQLLTDIDLASFTEWTPIGVPTTVSNGNNNSGYTGAAFRDKFNGAGHTIKNFKPTATVAAEGTFGLFGILDGATIKNLNVECDLTISAEAQGDAGVLAGTVISSTIENVNVSGKVTSNGTAMNSKRFAVGGIAGFAFTAGGKATVIKNCTTDLVANATSGSNTANGATCAMFGGIAGFITSDKGETERTLVESCTTLGEYTFALGRASGICATSNCGGVFKECVNKANQVNAFVNGRVGNIVSLLNLNSRIEDCINYGNLTTSDSQTTAGAFVALFNDDSTVLKGGANYGTIIGKNTKYLGLIGANLSKFTSISGVQIGGKIGEYDAGGNHTMYDVNSSNYMDYIGSVSDANKAKISDITFISGK